jgi:hypothetical protein
VWKPASARAPVATVSGSGFAGRDGNAEAYAFGSDEATAHATGSVALARAETAGGMGPLATDASSHGGLVTALEARSGGSPNHGSSALESRAAVGGPAPGLALGAGLQGVAFGTGLPSGADALAALVGNADVDLVLDAAGALALVALGGGVAVVSETFLDTTAALAYFDDHVLDLGGIAGGVSGDLDLAFLLSFTSDDPGAAFRTSLIFGVPEPSGMLLLALGGLALVGARRPR